MTDNVVKAGIEDVLSSVKRLVSEEGRKAPTSGARKPGRLVLTDALRISKPAQVERPPLKLEPKYSAEESAKPMLLRACDIVKADAANQDEPQVEETSAELEATDDPASSLSAKIEALEAAIARTEDQWEPDGDSDDAYSGTPTQGLAWTTDAGFEDPEPEDVRQDQADEAEAEAEPEQDDPEPATFIRSPEVMPVAEPVAEDPMPARDVAIDEDALRDMIADVVRQELQGVLGERITRNVRKMVRREIHRALTAQELE